MFKYEYCPGCDDFENCRYDGKYWNCPYTEGIEEDIKREENEEF